MPAAGKLWAPMPDLIDLGECVCGVQIFASKEHTAVAHGLPYCKQFREMEPLEFLTYVRRSRGISDESARKIAGF